MRPSFALELATVGQGESQAGPHLGHRDRSTVRRLVLALPPGDVPNIRDVNEKIPPTLGPGPGPGPGSGPVVL